MRMLVGTNTKMNLTSSQTTAYCETLRRLTADVEHCEVFVLPPYTSIWAARDQLAGSHVGWGAQDVHVNDEGPHTGEVSAPMLADLGCRYVAVGHSERRRQRGETDELVATKTRQVLRFGMSPIICVGEPVQMAPYDAAAFVSAQVTTALRDTPRSERHGVIVAYEPEWAIGAGAQPAEPGYVDVVHRAIANAVGSDTEDGSTVRVIYGGSVDLTTAHALLERHSVQGLFVGRYALDPRAFAEVIGMVDREARDRATARGSAEPPV